jgi:hypothetical protein
MSQHLDSCCLRGKDISFFPKKKKDFSFLRNDASRIRYKYICAKKKRTADSKRTEPPVENPVYKSRSGNAFVNLFSVFYFAKRLKKNAFQNIKSIDFICKIKYGSSAFLAQKIYVSETLKVSET